MVDQLAILVIILRILVFVLGGVVVWLGIRGYQKTRERFMLFVAVGLILVTLGSFIEGVFFEFAGRTNPAHALETSLSALGFLVIIYAVRRTG